MTKDEAIQLLDLCGLETSDKDLLQIFCDFAGVVAESEREACAAICDNQMEWGIISPQMKVSAGNCADLIRARGQG